MTENCCNSTCTVWHCSYVVCHAIEMVKPRTFRLWVGNFVVAAPHPHPAADEDGLPVWGSQFQRGELKCWWLCGFVSKKKTKNQCYLQYMMQLQYLKPFNLEFIPERFIIDLVLIHLRGKSNLLFASTFINLRPTFMYKGGGRSISWSDFTPRKWPKING